MTTMSHDDEHEDAGSSGDESPVIGTLRKQLADANKAAKAADERADTAVAEYQAEAAKVDAAREIVNKLGYPGLAEDVASALEEVTPEAVVAYLKERQLPLTDPDPSSDDDKDTSKDTSKPEDLEEVTSLAQSVASAAGDAGGKTVLDRISETETVEEVAEIAADEGFLQ